MTIDLHDLRLAWKWLGEGVALADAAARLNLKSSELDRAIWGWRMAVTASSEAQHRPAESLERLRRLAPFDPLAAKMLAQATERAAA